MKTIIPVTAAGDIAGWPVLASGGRLANTLAMKNGMVAVMKTPMTSQLQEKMSNNARAQRRALMEPMPSQINVTATQPYMATAGRITAVSVGGAFGAFAAIIWPDHT